MRRIRDEHGDGLRTLLVVVGIGLGFALLWDIGHPEPPRSQQLPTCGTEVGYPCRDLRSDGTLMVRWVTTARGLEESTTAEYDEGYLDWLQESAPPCGEGTGIGPTNSC